MEIEIEVQHPVYTELLGNGYNAFPISGQTEGTAYSRPIQRLTMNINTDLTKLTGVEWMDQNKLLGFFGGAKYAGKDLYAGKDYENISSPVALSAGGHVLSGDTEGEKDIIKCWHGPAVNWTGLDLP